MGGTKKAPPGKDNGSKARAAQQALQAKQAQQAAREGQRAENAFEEKPKRSCLQKQLRKTKYCMYHLQGVCNFGDSCAFAHNIMELQGPPDLTKTRICKAFLCGSCQDKECAFAHSEEELRSTDMFYKKTLCMWYEKGRCRNGDQCRFAHGMNEIRPLVTQQGSKGANPTGDDYVKKPNNVKPNRKLGASAKAVPETVLASSGIVANGDGAAGPVPLSEMINNNKTNNVSSKSFEPMFVQPLPHLGLVHSSASASGGCGLEQSRQVLDGAGSSLFSMESNGLGLGVMTPPQPDLDMLGRYEWQMEQLQRASAAAATAAMGGRMQGSKALQADLEKLTENIAALSHQLGRFEHAMQKCASLEQGRMRPPRIAGVESSMLKQAPYQPQLQGHASHFEAPAVGSPYCFGDMAMAGAIGQYGANGYGIS